MGRGRCTNCGTPLTHAAEGGASTSTLLAYSGHSSVRPLAQFARVSAETVGNWQAQRYSGGTARPPTLGPPETVHVDGYTRGPGTAFGQDSGNGER